MAHTYWKGSDKIILGKPDGLSKTTGWRTWNAAILALEWLKEEDRVRGKKIIDLSSGNGLVSIGCMKLGARKVIATECKDCVELLRRNVQDNGSDVEVLEYNWGQSAANILYSSEEPDYVVLSDLLFIAFRDSIELLLLNTFLTMGRHSQTQLILCYEERLVDRETAFLDSLRKHFHIQEVDISNELMELIKHAEDAYEGEEGHEVTGGGDLFYEPPPMRLLILTNLQK
jgi:predicted nicotinamide N-methyase